MNEADRQAALREYDYACSQFNFLMDQRCKIFDWYAKLVLLPTAFLTYVSTLGEDSDKSLGTASLGLLLMAVSLVGMLLFLYYVAETFASGSHVDRIRVIRNAIVSSVEDKGLRRALEHDRTEYQALASFYVPFFRGMAFAAMNSLVAAMSCQSFLGSHVASVSAFVAVLLWHYYIYQFANYMVSPAGLRALYIRVYPKRSKSYAIAAIYSLNTVRHKIRRWLRLR